jgi:hypothetical protein
MKPSVRPQPSAKKSHIFRKALLAGFAAYLGLSILAGIAIADVSLKLHRLPLRYQHGYTPMILRNVFTVLESPMAPH